jgi:hypothetical protein
MTGRKKGERWGGKEARRMIRKQWKEKIITKRKRK